jgi:hypothetical protein
MEPFRNEEASGVAGAAALVKKVWLLIGKVG